MKKRYFVTAIGTDSGKTFFSAILTEALQADYWKPIQSGSPTDSSQIIKLLSNPKSKVFKEAYQLHQPLSPHAAAALEGKKIDLAQIEMPFFQDTIVIEGAGGILVPLNDTHFVIDLAIKFEADIILVANLYLGSINHTLLSAAELKRRGLSVKGIVFNGERNAESERIILHHTGYSKLLHLEPEKEVNKAVVKRYAALLKEKLMP
ncbi:dethiobiotin synthase [Hugenholtzia roseola]|uniref:dethiobiotin synthase n=1 Tax=Hugenholtzia roseola TaxID=1002 RepID=UPI00041ADC85|nr:dethiobiotin synthase [Hugenholtzia roseola]